MRCSKCGVDNRDGRKFCADCGAPIGAQCLQCGASNAPGEKFCGECGVSLAGNTSNAPTAPHRVGEPSSASDHRASSSVPEGERKTVTALFADIKGSTQMMRDLDPEDARAIIDPAIQLMIKAVHRYDGYVVQSTGDGILAVFGAPAAHEDHPQRALHAALATFEELRRAGELQAPGRTGVEVRIGINTGEVVMRLVQTGGHTEYSPIGHAINLAKRVEGAAPTGGIAVSDETRRLVEGYFELRSLVPTVEEP
jgi:class 3 adenylate cyclase